jgi:hypothetical protein
MTLKAIPMNLAEANLLVKAHHRHNGVLRSGCFFAIGCIDTDRQAIQDAPLRGPNGELVVGSVIVGPVAARLLYRPWAAEVRRLVTDGTPNACSFLYGAAWRAAKALGYEGLITFTLTVEPGKSLLASNWRLDEAHVPVRTWRSRAPEFAHLRWSERPVTANSPALPRFRWFIGRRVPSQSEITYPDDGDDCKALRLAHGIREMTVDKVIPSLRSKSGVGSTLERSASNRETPVQLGDAA